MIEINTNPALFTDTKVQKEMLPLLVDDIVNIALKLHPLGKTDGEMELKEFLESEEAKQLKLNYDIIYHE